MTEAVATPGKIAIKVFRYEARVRCAYCARIKYVQGQDEAEMRKYLASSGWMEGPKGFLCRRCQLDGRTGEDPGWRAVVVQDIKEMLADEPQDRKWGNTTELPVVAGHQVTASQWAAFFTWNITGNKTASAEAANVSVHQLAAWKKTAWWAELWADQVEDRNRSLERDLMDLDDAAVVAYQEIMSGDRSEDRSVNAQAQLLKHRLTIGERPLIKTRPEVQITNNSLTGGGALVMAKVDLSGLTADDMRDIALGVRPLPTELRR